MSGTGLPAIAFLAVAPRIVPLSANTLIESMKAPAGSSCPGGATFSQSSQGRVVGLMTALSRTLGSLSTSSTPIITPERPGRSQAAMSNSDLSS